MPEHFERVLPFTTPAYRQDLRDVLLQGYVAAREADLPIELVRERDGIPDSALLYLAPCSKLLTAPGIDRLGALAQGGATVYLSYFAGSTANQRGPWLTSLDEIFGVRHRLRHGLVDPIVDDEVEFEFVEDFGDLPSGTRFSFRVAGEPSARAYLPVDLAGAEVVAVDGYGRPCPRPERRRRRPGRSLHLPARVHGGADAVGEPREHLADLLRARGGRRRARPVRVDDPRVLVGRVASGGSETVVLVNCSDDRVTLRPSAGDGEQPRRLPADPRAVRCRDAAARRARFPRFRVE